MNTKTTTMMRGLLAAAVLSACSDEGESEPATAATASSAETSAGPTTATGEGAGGGGLGGAGGSGGAVGAGGGAGGVGACLDASDFADAFTLAKDDLCAVALYDAPGLETLQYGTLPTWGRHGGLLAGSFDTTDGGIASVVLHRYAAPPGVNGELVDEASAGIEVGLAPSVFAGAQVVDLWGDLSAFDYTGTPFETEGGLVLLDEGGVLQDYPLIGGFGLGALSTLPAERLLYAALSPIDDVGTLATGLYVAERCDPEGALCDAAAIATWGDATGPLAIDAAGNAFAVMISFDGTQTARGWSADQLAPGAEAGEGVEVFTLGGFGSPMAALAPSGGAPGQLVFQPADATTFLPVPPVVVRYEVVDGAVVATGEPEPLLDLATDEAPISVVADDEERLWIGVPRASGGTRFVVLARR